MAASESDGRPPPLTPADCDLTDFPFMPVVTDRLLKSETWSLGTGDERAAAVALWFESWHQVPAASIPGDDRLQKKLADSDRWPKVKAQALRGWIVCQDGRLYHPVVAQQALAAWVEKLMSAAAGAVGNWKRWGTPYDRDAMLARLQDAITRLRASHPESRILRKKGVVAVMAGYLPGESLPDRIPSPPDPQKASPPDPHGGSPPDIAPRPVLDRNRHRQGQGQGSMNTNTTEASPLSPAAAAAGPLNGRQVNGHHPPDPDNPMGGGLSDPKAWGDVLPGVDPAPPLADGPPPCPHAKLVALYAKHLPHLPQPRIWDGARAEAMRARWRQCSRPTAFGKGYRTEAEGLIFWDRLFAYVASCPTLHDGIPRSNGSAWMPDLPWICKAENFAKIIEGKYA